MTHTEQRQWTIEKLGWLRDFCDDKDLMLDTTRVETERRDLAACIEQVRTGRYSVVFLGAFNVGKSTLINALLGGEYLPSAAEECTGQIVRLVHSDIVGVSVTLGEKPRQRDMDAMRAALGPGVTLTANESGVALAYDRTSVSPEVVSSSLRPLVTVQGREGEKGLLELAQRIQGITVSLPLPGWAQDVVLTDSPGVHSMDETRQAITYDVIPKSHLVVLLVDSESAGNRPDMEFIRRVIQNRRRHVFFPINKADQLEEDSIDPTGIRGPARSLRRSLAGVLDAPEVFFVAGLFALRARQLAQGTVSLDSVLKSNRTRIPFHMVEECAGDRDALRDRVIRYLLKASRISEFEERVDNYLHCENKESAVTEDGLRRIVVLGDEFASRLGSQLAAAKDPKVIATLRAESKSRRAKLEQTKRAAHAAFDMFSARMQGAVVGGVRYESILDRPTALFAAERVDKEVVYPLEKWLQEDANLAETLKHKQCGPSRDRFAGLIDDFQAKAVQTLEDEFGRASQELEGELLRILGDFRRLQRCQLATIETPSTIVDASILVEFLRDMGVGGLGGAGTGAAAGAAIAAALSGGLGAAAGALIGAGIGILVGGTGGAVLSTAKVRENQRKKLVKLFRQKAHEILIDGWADTEGHTRPSVRELVQGRIKDMCGRIDTESREQFDRKVAGLAAELDDLVAREKEITADREVIVARLVPKIDELAQVLGTANAALGQLGGAGGPAAHVNRGA